MTASNSGIYGNFGQANYSAAKMGLIGLNNTLAIEGGKNNIKCNVIVPTAASRLTEDILPPGSIWKIILFKLIVIWKNITFIIHYISIDFFAELKPELIAPVVAFLCHESCEANGCIIDSAAGWAGQCIIVKSRGSLLRTNIGDPVTIENVRDNWSSITDMSNAKQMKNIQVIYY